MAETPNAAAALPVAVVMVPTKPVHDPLVVDKEHRRWNYTELPIGFHGYVRNTDPQPPLVETAWMNWVGGLIPLELWNQVCAFFEWSQETFKSEAQVRLYYNRTTRKWAVWAYPQRPSGMTTKELDDHPDFEKQRTQFNSDWVTLGTVHHHCTMGAFQSGTDKSNETQQDGVHITVGNLTSPEYTLHGRVQLRGQEYGCLWTQWFSAPEVSTKLPYKLQSYLLDYYLKAPPAKDTPFPEQWKKNCYPPVYTGGGGSSGYHSSDLRGGSASSTTRIPVVTSLKEQFTEDELQFMLVCQRLMRESTNTHGKADYLLFEAKDSSKLDENDKKFVHAVLTAANAFKLSSARVDQLFDVWDFATVLEELKVTETAPTQVKEGATAPEYCE